MPSLHVPFDRKQQINWNLMNSLVGKKVANCSVRIYAWPVLASLERSSRTPRILRSAMIRTVNAGTMLRGTFCGCATNFVRFTAKAQTVYSVAYAHTHLSYPWNTRVSSITPLMFPLLFPLFFSRAKSLFLYLHLSWLLYLHIMNYSSNIISLFTREAREIRPQTSYTIMYNKCRLPYPKSYHPRVFSKFYRLRYICIRI